MTTVEAEAAFEMVPCPALTAEAAGAVKAADAAGLPGVQQLKDQLMQLSFASPGDKLSVTRGGTMTVQARSMLSPFVRTIVRDGREHTVNAVNGLALQVCARTMAMMDGVGSGSPRQPWKKCLEAGIRGLKNVQQTYASSSDGHETAAALGVAIVSLQLSAHIVSDAAGDEVGAGGGDVDVDVAVHVAGGAGGEVACDATPTRGDAEHAPIVSEPHGGAPTPAPTLASEGGLGFGFSGLMAEPMVYGCGGGGGGVGSAPALALPPSPPAGGGGEHDSDRFLTPSPSMDTTSPQAPPPLPAKGSGLQLLCPTAVSPVRDWGGRLGAGGEPCASPPCTPCAQAEALAVEERTALPLPPPGYVKVQAPAGTGGASAVAGNAKAMSTTTWTPDDPGLKRVVAAPAAPAAPPARRQAPDVVSIPSLFGRSSGSNGSPIAVGSGAGTGASATSTMATITTSRRGPGPGTASGAGSKL
jgi:hypothetical protein